MVVPAIVLKTQIGWNADAFDIFEKRLFHSDKSIVPATAHNGYRTGKIFAEAVTDIISYARSCVNNSVFGCGKFTAEEKTVNINWLTERRLKRRNFTSLNTLNAEIGF